MDLVEKDFDELFESKDAYKLNEKFGSYYNSKQDKLKNIRKALKETHPKLEKESKLSIFARRYA